MSEENGEAVVEVEVPQERVELPRGHWLSVRDPWEVTESQMREFRRGRPKAPATPGPVAPQVAAQSDDEDDPLTRDRAYYAICWVVTAWGGPLLDGKPVTPETIESLPVPLATAIAKANNGFWSSLSGEEPSESPTTP